MSFLSDERISHIAHLIQKQLLQDQLVATDEPEKLLREIKTGMNRYLKADDAIEALVRNKISSQRKNIQEGSPEWDVLYRKYFEEELDKHRL